MAQTIDDLASDVRKVMDARLKWPKNPGLDKVAREVAAKSADFRNKRDELQVVIRGLHKTIFDMAAEAERFAAQLGKSDFGLDAEAPDYKKKRGAAQKVIDKFFGEVGKVAVKNGEKMTELSKHIEDLANYKGPEVSFE